LAKNNVILFFILFFYLNFFTKKIQKNIIFLQENLKKYDFFTKKVVFFQNLP